MDPQLEQEIIALVKRYARSTNVSSRVGQRVTDTGLVEYEFEGVLKALGLTLDEAVAAGGPPNEISWEDAGGVQRQHIFGLLLGGQHMLELYGHSGGAGFTRAQLQLLSDPAFSRLKTILGVVEKTIYDSLGRSGFLQLPEVLARFIDVGVSVAPFPGATTRSNIVTVKHKLGVVPTSVQVTAMGSEAAEIGMMPRVIEGSLTKEQFKVRLFTTVAIAAIEIPFTWTAIG